MNFGFRGGRGGPMHGGAMRGGWGGGPGPRPSGGPPTARPPPFDLTLCEPMFPKAHESDETAVTQALLKRNQDLSPTPQEQASILNLITKVKAALEKMIVAPELFTAAVVEEAREVGSYKKGTMLTKSNVADLVVILRTLPTVEAVSALGNKIVEEIKAAEPKEVLGCVPRDYGCEIAGTQAVIRLLIATLPQNLKMLEPDLHLNEAIMVRHLAALRHARWFEENASHSSVKVLVRLLKDVRKRFAGFKVLSVWGVELLAHYAVMNTPSRQALALNQAFRRVFQLLSAGLFLPNSPGLVDPCDPSARIQQGLTMEEMDLLCSTSQTLLRVLSHGGYKQVLGLEGSATVATEMSFWDGIVVTPLEKAYDAKEMEPLIVGEDGNTEMMEIQQPAAAAVEATA
uniref:DZF domain-containing protein n=1 Tax=Plectus sambesii TaxID=2011161 RepID=A0A914V6K6_9BILA